MPNEYDLIERATLAAEAAWPNEEDRVSRDPFPATDLPGIKHDQGKDRISLLPFRALRQVAKVLTFGAKKYGPNNWQGVETERYEDAMFRHYEAWRAGETSDPESGLHHLAHMTCCALFILAQKTGLDGKRGGE